MRGSQCQPSVSGCARMRALPSTRATHQARGTDRQLHCPHLTWQAVTVRSDRSVPGLFICCRWERSWVGQIALHTERDSHHCFEVWATVCVHSLAASLATGQVARFFFCLFFFLPGEKSNVFCGFYLLMTSLCCQLSGNERRRFIQLSAKWCSHRSTSRWVFTAALSGMVMYGAHGAALALLYQQRKVRSL